MKFKQRQPYWQTMKQQKMRLKSIFSQVKRLFHHLPKWIQIILAAVLSLSLAILIILQFKIHRSSKQTPQFKRQLISGLIGEWDYSLTTNNGQLTTSLGTNRESLNMKVTHHNSSVTFAAPLTKPKIKASNSQTVTYQSANQLVSVKYQPLPTGIKEEIILAADPQTTTFVSKIILQQTEPRVTPDGQILFVNDEGEYQFHIQPPFAHDATGNTTYNLKYRLIDKANETAAGDELNQQASPYEQSYLDISQVVGGANISRQLLGPVSETQAALTPAKEYYLILEVDPSWLQDPQRQYPITIDPTVVHDTTSEFATGSFNRNQDTGQGSLPSIETTYQELPTDEHTTALWHMNEGSDNTCTGGEDICDVSGNNNDGTFNGTAAFAGNGKLGGDSITLDGNSDYVSVTSNTTPQSNLTIDAWIYLADISASNTIYNWGPTSGCNPSSQYFFTDTSGALRFGTGCGTQITSTETIATNRWTHVALTIDSSGNATLYINGQQQNTPTNTRSGQSVGQGNDLIGAIYSGGTLGSYFSGQIDEVRVSNVARTAEEIKAAASRRPYSIYTSPVIDLSDAVTSWNSLSWNEWGVATGDGETVYDSTGLVAQWNFNETSGTTANNDAEGSSCGGTPSDCDGTLSGFDSTSSQDADPDSSWTANNRRWGTGALQFDGVDSYVYVTDTVPSLEMGDHDLTISAWINMRSLATNNHIIMKGSSNSTDEGYQFRVNTSRQLEAYVSDGASWTLNTASSGQVPINTWSHVAWTIERNGNSTFYINGVADNNVVAFTDTSNIQSNDSFTIGANNGLSIFNNGTIDSVQLYSRALPHHEILSLSNSSNLEFQTRVGADNSPNDGSWNEWAPLTSEAQIESFDGPFQYSTTDSGLVGYWPMDETADNSCSVSEDVCDAKSSSHGTATNTTIVNGKFSKGRGFNGTTDYVEIANNSAFNTDAVSAFAWIKTNGQITSNNDILAMGDWGTTQELQWFMRVDDTAGKIQVGIYESGGKGGNYKVYLSDQEVDDSQWHQVGFTFESNTLSLYIDGSEAAVTKETDNTITSIYNTDEPFSIGALDIDGYTNFYKGTIDEVRIFNTALSASTIQQYYLEGSTNPDTLHSSTATTSAQVFVEGNSSEKITIGQPLIDEHTVALYHLDETNGDNAGDDIFDATSNNNDGEFNGSNLATAIVEGVSGKAREFNGSNDYIQISDSSSLDIAGNVTGEIWLKWDSTGNTSMLRKNDNYVFVQENGGTVRCVLWPGGTQTNTTYFASSDIITNKWYHLACTYNGSSIKTYVDGVLANTTSASGNLNTNNLNLVIGASESPGEYFDGAIDEVRISNIARTAEEISESYRLGRDHYLNKTISSTDLSDDTKLPFYIAADRPGTYLNATVGESAYANYQPDTNTVGLWHLDDLNSDYTRVDSAGYNDGNYAKFWLGDDDYTHSGFPTCDGGVGRGIYVIVELNQTKTLTCYDTHASSSSSENLATYLNNLANETKVFMAVKDSASSNLTTNAKTAITNLGSTSINSLAYRNGWSFIATKGVGKHAEQLVTSGVASVNHTFELVADSSGNENHGDQTNGPTLVQGKIGSAVKFDGTDDYVSLGNPSSLQMTGDQTIELWLYPTDFSARRNPYAKAYGGEGAITQETDGTINYYYGTAGANSSPYQAINSVQSLNLNQWNHVAVTRDLTSMTLSWYINGQLTNSTAASYASATASSLSAYIGDGYMNNYAGNIDEVRISNTARSATEIRQAYEVGRRTYPITIDFAASGDSGNLITSGADLSFTVDATAYGLEDKGSGLYLGDTLIVREVIDDTEYIAQATASAVTTATGAVTVPGWHGGSTFPSGGYTANAAFFKWQEEYWDISDVTLSDHLNAVTNLTLRVTNGHEGRTIWLDDLRSGGAYLTNPSGSTITSSTGNQYFQYRAILSSWDEAVSATMSAVTLDYVSNSAPNTPSLNSPSDTATNQTLTPTLLTTATDADADYLRYKIELCENAAMTTNCSTFDQTSSQTGWSGQDAQTSTAYASGTQATYTLQSSLSAATTYYWRSYAIDPGGSNTWSSTQGTPYSFTTTNAPTAPTTPYAEGQTNPTGIVDLTPEFSAIHNDPDGDSADYYQILVNTASDFTGTSMWDSGKSSMATTANANRSPDISYAGTSLSYGGTTYYWKIKFWDTFGVEGVYSAVQSFSSNIAPNTPSLDSPANGATNQLWYTVLKTTTTDTESDYLRYKIELCTDAAMQTSCSTFDQTSSQTGWSGQNTQSNTAYASGTQATYTLQTPLSQNSTYYWRSYAIDPGGRNTWSSTQGTPYSFTTANFLVLTRQCLLQEARDDSQIIFTWLDQSNDEDGYEVQRSVNSGAWGSLQTYAADANSHTDDTISQGNTYQYRVAPYYTGPIYGDWCASPLLTIEAGLFNFEGVNFAGVRID